MVLLVECETLCVILRCNEKVSDTDFGCQSLIVIHYLWIQVKHTMGVVLNMSTEGLLIHLLCEETGDYNIASR